MTTNFLGAEFGCWLSRASYSVQFTEEREREQQRRSEIFGTCFWMQPFWLCEIHIKGFGTEILPVTFLLAHVKISFYGLSDLHEQHYMQLTHQLLPLFFNIVIPNNYLFSQIGTGKKIPLWLKSGCSTANGNITFHLIVELVSRNCCVSEADSIPNCYVCAVIRCRCVRACACVCNDTFQ